LTSETHNNNSKKKELFRRDLITQESIGEEMGEGGIDGWVQNGQETNLY